ncbi:Serine/threonine-protein kinase AfsK [Slackia heliotrinireducens]|uniref:Serine/threonine protein kinase n=1 Tax=Slackia heliotrinireducens (strain ATCC 29202 / DSM 20476 / NCTC 11029 / RHS 1) TaxID=471855 RepID=C7N505_SLAHD|nr:serine/threonine protein kinase [Slackia heliotrinireducens]ACV21990.1 serine/threonine protein kinase [Slackia heliotrinireducens DSM 20476]VEG99882.1 Serine/threonine-protein kinase AfsK [Slackia heliotrinireducens]
MTNDAKPDNLRPRPTSTGRAGARNTSAPSGGTIRGIGSSGGVLHLRIRDSYGKSGIRFASDLNVRIVQQLGSGGQGRVVLVADGSGQRFALKTFESERAMQVEWEALLLHANERIAPMPYACGVLATNPAAAADAFVLMEYISGTNLASELAHPNRWPLDLCQALETIGPVIRFAAHACAARNVHAHCDIKPSNIVVSEGGVRLIDFGISKGPDGRGLARGTYGFSAPEQYFQEAGLGVGTDVDAVARIDAYSIAATFYALMNKGNPPGYPAVEAVAAMKFPEFRPNTKRIVDAERIAAEEIARETGFPADDSAVRSIVQAAYRDVVERMRSLMAQALDSDASMRPTPLQLEDTWPIRPGEFAEEVRTRVRYLALKHAKERLSWMSGVSEMLTTLDAAAEGVSLLFDDDEMEEAMAISVDDCRKEFLALDPDSEDCFDLAFGILGVLCIQEPDDVGGVLKAVSFGNAKITPATPQGELALEIIGSLFS